MYCLGYMDECRDGRRAATNVSHWTAASAARLHSRYITMTVFQSRHPEDEGS